MFRDGNGERGSPGATALVTAALLGVAATAAGAVTGHLHRASPRTMVIDGSTYRVARDARTVPLGHPLGDRQLYRLTEEEIASLPAYRFRAFRAVTRVRVRLEEGRVRVVQPLGIPR